MSGLWNVEIHDLRKGMQAGSKMLAEAACSLQRYCTHSSRWEVSLAIILTMRQSPISNSNMRQDGKDMLQLQRIPQCSIALRGI